jgi:hypothetical protein
MYPLVLSLLAVALLLRIHREGCFRVPARVEIHCTLRFGRVHLGVTSFRPARVYWRIAIGGAT